MTATADALMGIFGYKRVKPKRCRTCREHFEPRNMAHICCSAPCAISYALTQSERKRAKKEQEERKRIREKLSKLKTRSQWMKEAQSEFNRYIRERDKGKPCICCGQPLESGDTGGAYDCGHYRSVGSAPHLRFNESNAHAQRKQCNRWGAGRAVDYRLGLIARIGLEAVEALESDQDTRKWSIEELIQIKRLYQGKLKALKEKNENL